MVQARPHDRVALDLADIELDEAGLRNLPWVRAGVASVRRVGSSFELELGPYAGELWLDQQTRIDVVELLPGTVATCLRLSSTGRRIADQPIAGAGRLRPTAAVAAAYAEAVVHAISFGVHKEYVARTVRSNRPRGKLDIAATARGPWAAGRFDQVVTRRRDLSEDNALNRALLAACLEAEWRLAGQALDLARIRSAATALRGAALDRKAVVPSPLDVPSRFAAPLALARDLLQGVATVTGRRHEHGKHSAWINVERVFEEAVRSLFEELFSGDVTRGEAAGVGLFTALASEPSPTHKTANPDVVLRGHDGLIAVADAKYRRSGELVTDDALYQIISHAGAFDATAAALVTPALKDRPGIRRLGRVAGGCTVDVVSVNSASSHQMRDAISRWIDTIQSG